MPWQAHWHDDNEDILVMQGSNPWTWDDMRANIETWRERMAQKPHVVHIVIETEDGLKMPETASDSERVPPFLRFKELFVSAEDNHGLVIFIAPPLFFEDTVRNAQRLLREQMDTQYVHFAKSMQEAQQIIAAQGRA